ncbi:uncharacterized protein BYT42DRAFT_331638 [Radiomyces spectabilis]|uniref:uncharacterized protein n=1 Tax=Radiomyces spectabilis TaxID=64574 RepID=UPI002220532F|nr:uncharacterized protein BYT42DRAFT_331638 [Radiomyces spectabilis]KAI8379572.1 hypothetical protein BYT42DRAFT_331638 [Radiomyces spectabilis]
MYSPNTSSNTTTSSGYTTNAATPSKKRSKNLARELDHLVNYNGKRAKRDLPKCPVCQQRIDIDHWAAHYQYELSRLNEPTSEVFSDPLDKTKGKRGAAVHARQQLGRWTGKKKTSSVYEETLEKIQKNRASRKEAIKRMDAPRTVEEAFTADDESFALSQAMLEDTAVQTCFICNETLHGDSEAVNLHIDHCLANMGNEASTETEQTSASMQSSVSPPPAENGWEEYEWAGQRRVRATAMMEGGYGGAGFATTSKGDDVDEDLDVEEDDDDQYGGTQYTERDIVVNDENENEEVLALREMVTSGVTSGVARSAAAVVGSEETDSVRSGFEETVSDIGWERHLARETVLDSGGHAGSRLVIESLKSRIHQLEAASRSAPRCLICLEPYKTPVVSIVCWHVHCEQCWLQTLGSKKLCPQCQKITTPADLRRIYL